MHDWIIQSSQNDDSISYVIGGDEQDIIPRICWDPYKGGMSHKWYFCRCNWILMQHKQVCHSWWPHWTWCGTTINLSVSIDDVRLHSSVGKLTREEAKFSVEMFWISNWMKEIAWGAFDSPYNNSVYLRWWQVDYVH